jgi:uncharacterized membrane protein required for colicin V production
MLLKLLPSWLDLGLLCVALAGLFIGMKIGVVSAFFDAAGGLAGGWVASRSYAWLADSTPLPPVAAYLAVFSVVAASFVVLGIVTSQRLAPYFLGLEDKFFGAFLGMALTFVMSTALLLPFLTARPDMARRSAFAVYVVRTAQTYFFLVPQDQWLKIEPLLEAENVRRVRRFLEEKS